MKGLNYNKIYKDLLKKHGIKVEIEISAILKKKQWNSLDVIYMSQLLSKKDSFFEQKRSNASLLSYDKESIEYILLYQKKHKLTTIDLAKKFNISRNTISKWKKESNGNK